MPASACAPLQVHALRASQQEAQTRGSLVTLGLVVPANAYSFYGRALQATRMPLGLVEAAACEGLGAAAMTGVCARPLLGGACVQVRRAGVI
jgi:hypothetical protein